MIHMMNEVTNDDNYDVNCDEKFRMMMMMMMRGIIEVTNNNNNINEEEKREEEDLPALKTALTHRYNDSKTIYQNTMKDWLQPSETIMITRWTTEWQ